MARRRVGLAVLASLFALALASCSSTVPAAPTRLSSDASASAGGVERITANGRTLLLRPVRDGLDQATYAGVLGTNSAHCVTVGRYVLIAPQGSKLLPDGSVVLRGERLQVGSRVHISGAFDTERPVRSPCRVPQSGYWLG